MARRAWPLRSRAKPKAPISSQTIRLSAGDAGNRVEFTDSIDWRTLYANLKAVFPLYRQQPDGHLQLGIGTIQRPTAFDRQFEVASHHWIDLTDKSGSLRRHHSHRCEERLRQTRRPHHPPYSGAHARAPIRNQLASYTDQLNQDWGHHEILFGIAGHAGDWRAGQTDWQAYRLNTPLIAFDDREACRRAGQQLFAGEASTIRASASWR